MQFQVLYFTFICYQLILIKEFVPKMKYLCFDLMFLSKINQVILVAILLFLDLRSVLQMIFFVTFYFLLFLFDQTILVLDGCYFQTSKIITTSIGIIWHCVHFERNCYIFIFYLPQKISLFLLLFSGYYLALFIFHLYIYLILLSLLSTL